MTTFKLLQGLGMTVVLLGIAGAALGSPRKHGINLDRTHEALRLSPDLDDPSSSGATTAPTSEQ